MHRLSLQPAFAVNGTEPDNVTFAMGGRLTFLDIAGYGSELRTDFSFGNTYGISTEFYKRFSQTSRWFFAPRVSASDAAQWIFSHSNPQADYRIGQVEFGTDLGYAVSRFSEVRAGYEIGYLDANLKIGTPLFQSVKGQVGASRFRFVTEHRDDPIIPRQGYFGELNFHWVDTSPGAPAAFPSLEARTEYFKTVSYAGFCVPDSSGRLDHRLRPHRHSSILPRRYGRAACLWPERGTRRSVLPLPRGILT